MTVPFQLPLDVTSIVKQEHEKIYKKVLLSMKIWKYRIQYQTLVTSTQRNASNTTRMQITAIKASVYIFGGLTTHILACDFHSSYQMVFVFVIKSAHTGSGQLDLFHKSLQRLSNMLENIVPCNASELSRSELSFQPLLHIRLAYLQAELNVIHD